MASDAQHPKPRLPRGRSALDPDDRGRAHRLRLQDALVELVAEQGFADTRIRDICARAHVAPGDLYSQYPRKQELLLSTCDAIVDDACVAVRAALRGDREPAPDLERAVAEVLLPLGRAVAARPAQASLVLVDVFSGGAIGPPYRRGLVARLQTLLAEALADVPGPGRLSEASLTVVAAGTIQVFERRVRAGRARSLPGLAPELAAWAAGYRTAAPLPLPRPGPARTTPSVDRSQRLPRNTQRLPRQFVVPHQRDRILRAVVELAARDGYASISIPAIAGEAQISIRTFYQHFSSKHEAFTAVYDQAFGRLFAKTWSAASGQTSWPDAVREGVRAWASYIAEEPRLARFGFSDVLTAGPKAVEKVDDAFYAFADLFGRGRPGDLGTSDLVAYAIAGGIGGLVGAWIADGQAAEARQLVPHLIYAVLAPATGDAEALHLSGLTPVPAVLPVPAPTDDGQRIAVAFAALVADEGYRAATLEEAARRADVDPSLVGEFFEDAADCTLQTLDSWTDRTFTAMAAAFASAPRDGALAVHRALGAMLAQMAVEPTMLQLAIEAIEQLGPQVLSRRARYATVFFDAVTPTLGPDDPSPDGSRLTAETLVYGVLRRYAAEGRIAELPDALPEISYLCVAPFFGPQRAANVSQLPFAAVAGADPGAGRTAD